MTVSWLLLVVLTASTAAWSQLPPARAEGLAALVGGNHPGPGVSIVLRSDVELRAYLHLWAKGQSQMTPSPKLLSAAMDEIIGELLIAEEAERMQMGKPRADAVSAEWNRIAASMGGEAELQRFLKSKGASEKEIRVMAARRATVAFFLSANLEGESVVTEAAVDAALIAAGVTEPHLVPIEEREAERDRLSQENFERAVARWVTVLKARTTVRISAQFGGA